MVTVLGVMIVLSYGKSKFFVRFSNVLLNTVLLTGSCEFLRVMSHSLGFLVVTLSVESILDKLIS